MRIRAGVGIALSLLIALGGCASQAPRYYTLDSVRPGSATSAAERGPPGAPVAISVGPVSVPPVVDRPELVLATGRNEIRLDEFNRWAAPLGDNIARVVAENLVSLVGTPQVTLFPQRGAADADFRVAIEVQRFESRVGEAASLDAVWTARRVKDGATRSGRTTVREAVEGSGFDSLAAAHSRGIARLSADIAGAIGALEGR